MRRELLQLLVELLLRQLRLLVLLAPLLPAYLPEDPVSEEWHAVPSFLPELQEHEGLEDEASDGLQELQNPEPLKPCLRR